MYVFSVEKQNYHYIESVYTISELEFVFERYGDLLLPDWTIQKEMKQQKVYSYPRYNYTVLDEATNFNVTRKHSQGSYLAQTNYTLTVNATDNESYEEETLLNTTFIFLGHIRAHLDHAVLF